MKAESLIEVNSKKTISIQIVTLSLYYWGPTERLCSLEQNVVNNCFLYRIIMRDENTGLTTANHEGIFGLL